MIQSGDRVRIKESVISAWKGMVGTVDLVRADEVLVGWDSGAQRPLWFRFEEVEPVPANWRDER